MVRPPPIEGVDAHFADGRTDLKRAFLFMGALLLVVGSSSFAQTFAAKGLVLQVDAAHRTLVVSCDEIPNYMVAMVMPLTVRDPQELTGLTPGNMIDFTLVVDQQSSHIEKIARHRYEGLEQDPLGARRLKVLEQLSAPASLPPEIAIGAPVPDFSLVDQNRRRIALSQFNGKIVLMTFIYTHCPLPDFCFRISNNFGQLQRRFADRLGRDVILLSISFDPENDTPEVLAKYGSQWNADPNGWHLLTGAKPEIVRICQEFGMNFWLDEGIMTHSLHTVVVGPDGKLVTNLEGNDFAAAQLGDFVQALLEQPDIPKGRNSPK
jgi:protein SCO1